MFYLLLTAQSADHTPRSFLRHNLTDAAHDRRGGSGREAPAISERPRVDLKDGRAAGRVGEFDGYVHLEPARSQERRVNQLGTVGHADDEDVVERVDAIKL